MTKSNRHIQELLEICACLCRNLSPAHLMLENSTNGIIRAPPRLRSVQRMHLVSASHGPTSRVSCLVGLVGDTRPDCRAIHDSRYSPSWLRPPCFLTPIGDRFLSASCLLAIALAEASDARFKADTIWSDPARMILINSCKSISPSWIPTYLKPRESSSFS